MSDFYYETKTFTETILTFWKIFNDNDNACDNDNDNYSDDLETDLKTDLDTSYQLPFFFN